MLSFRHGKSLAAGFGGEIKSVPANKRHQKLYTRRALKAILELYNFHTVHCGGYPYLVEGRSYLAYNSIELYNEQAGGRHGDFGQLLQEVG